MYVVDASVWVAVYLPVDVHHVASKEWIEAQFEQGLDLVMPALVLPELTGAIARRSSTGIALDAMNELLHFSQLRVVEIDQEVGERSGQLAAELHLKGADAVYVATAELLGVPLVSWDGQQLERSARRVQVLSPT